VIPASLVLGAISAVWHLPLFWTHGTTLYGTSAWILLVELPAVSILFTWVFLHTGGSALLAILLHASMNLCTVSAFVVGYDLLPAGLLVLGLKWLLAGVVAASWVRDGVRTGPAKAG
jgi:hypothetical protein